MSKSMQYVINEAFIAMFVALAAGNRKYRVIDRRLVGSPLPLGT